ncbi:DinB family protein [Psychromarinibacter sp. S121]|uniref:DinB family protein n=1 Tax=Psychromarinibacter sp. S121 TaxID=3415127 RepID=UPI003C7E5CA1
MISAEYCRTMARYNRWQNGNLVGEADALGASARRAERGAFFGSIEKTLNHLLWADTMWMSRIDGWDKPRGGVTESLQFTESWEAYKTARTIADQGIRDWAWRVEDQDLLGDLTWYSGILKTNVAKPFWLCVTHFFNHQTHHRGKVHAMLTAAQGRPGDTDLFIMPETA